MRDLKSQKWSQATAFRLKISLSYLASIRGAECGVEGMCIMDSLAYVRASDAQHTNENIFSYNLSSNSITKLHQFGPVYQSNFYMASFLLSRGPMGCSTTNNRIVVAFTLMPYLYGLTPEGDVVWVTKLHDFQSSTVTETAASNNSGPGLTYDFRGETDIVLSIEELPNGYFIVQTQQREKITSGDLNILGTHTYLISSETGNGMYVGSSLPVVFDATETRLYTAVESPFPQIRVFKY